MSSRSDSLPASLSPPPPPDLEPQLATENDQNAPQTSMPVDDELSDADSILSDVDEAQFEDFDPNQIAIDDRPAIAVDEDNVKLLGRHKRKRDNDKSDKAESKSKRKEGRREKPRKAKKGSDSDDDFSGGQEVSGKRNRERKTTNDGFEGTRKEKHRPERSTALIDDESLDPEERRRRALDRAMDAALKNPTKRRRRGDGVDLNTMADEEIASLRIRMAEAAEADVKARSATPPMPAMHKLKLLPEVSALLNRNSRDVESAIVDPENNLLESVRFFLEPLSDGSLPAYNIQRELFASLSRLPIDKDALISSGLGKVILFYTKSKKPEPSIKRAAERLLGEWTRPILKRSDDYRKRVLESADYDASAPRSDVSSKRMDPAEAASLAKARAIALPVKSNRARAEIENKTYTIVPRSMQVSGGAFARPLGASGEDAFRRLKARQQAMMAPKRTVRG